MEQIFDAVILTNWKSLLSIGASVATILSFIAYLNEKRNRRDEKRNRILQKEYIMGFLKGLSGLSKARFQAGEEWRYDYNHGKTASETAATIANGAVNDYKMIIKLCKELEDKMQ